MSKPIPINGIVDTTESASLNLDQYEALLNKYKTHTNLMAVLFKEVQVCSRTLMAKDGTTDPEVETVKQRITDLEKQVKVLQVSMAKDHKRIRSRGYAKIDGFRPKRSTPSFQ